MHGRSRSWREPPLLGPTLGRRFASLKATVTCETSSEKEETCIYDFLVAYQAKITVHPARPFCKCMMQECPHSVCSQARSTAACSFAF
jgi:hypothetical protein